MVGKSGYFSSNLRGEKTLSVSFRLEDGKIKEIQISGDFFEFPEGSIDRLEDQLIEKGISEALKEIDNFQMVLYGITKEDLKRAILEAVHGQEN